MESRDTKGAKKISRFSLNPPTGGVAFSYLVIIKSMTHTPTDGGGLTFSGNLKSFWGPVLKCRVSRKHRDFYLNELVIHEIRNNVSVIIQNFLFQVL
jgi:hypothetical protein